MYMYTQKVHVLVKCKLPCRLFYFIPHPGTAEALIDNNWKLLSGSKRDFQGQCDFQKPYSLFQTFDEYYLFNLGEDYHELHDQKMNEPDRYNAMVKTLKNLKASIIESQQKETGLEVCQRR